MLAASPALAQPAGNLAHYDVYADRDGSAIHLLVGTGKKGNPSIALWHLRSSDAGASWSKPIRINTDADRLSAHHPGENPQIVAAGNRVFVAWTAPRTNAGGRGRGGLIRIATSDDGGATWQSGVTPYENAAGSQTFMKLAVHSANIHMAWLDSREGRQSLRYGRSTDSGVSWAGDTQLAARTCECCWNNMAVTAQSVSVMFRGDQPRDMMLISQRADGSWQAPAAIGNFDWRVNACPHVGGGMVAEGSTVHSVVWTGKDNMSGLHYLGSTDAGATWSVARRLGTVDANHPDLTRSRDGTLIAIWDEAGFRASTIMQSSSSDAGATWTAATKISASGGMMATMPRVVATQQGVATLWFEGFPNQGASLVVNGKPLAIPPFNGH